MKFYFVGLMPICNCTYSQPPVLDHISNWHEDDDYNTHFSLDNFGDPPEYTADETPSSSLSSPDIIQRFFRNGVVTVPDNGATPTPTFLANRILQDPNGAEYGLSNIASMPIASTVPIKPKNTNGDNDSLLSDSLEERISMSSSSLGGEASELQLENDNGDQNNPEAGGCTPENCTLIANLYDAIRLHGKGAYYCFAKDSTVANANGCSHRANHCEDCKYYNRGTVLPDTQGSIYRVDSCTKIHPTRENASAYRDYNQNTGSSFDANFRGTSLFNSMGANPDRFRHPLSANGSFISASHSNYFEDSWIHALHSH